MQFELTHQDIDAAFKAYVKDKVASTDGLTFIIKTSRKGKRTSRAIITIGESINQIPLNIESVEPIVQDTVQEEITQITEEQSTVPTKKLFE